EVAGEESAATDEESERLFLGHWLTLFGPEGDGIEHAQHEQQRAPPHSDVILAELDVGFRRRRYGRADDQDTVDRQQHADEEPDRDFLFPMHDLLSLPEDNVQNYEND